MQTEEARRIVHRFRQTADRQAACVCRHDGRVVEDRVETPEELFFQIEAFEDGLDDQVGRSGESDIGAAGKPGFGRRGIFGTHPAFFRIPVVETAHRFNSALDRFLRNIDHPHVNPMLCDIGGDAGAHSAGADDGDCFECHL